jgi:hypothetical protein
MNTCFMVYLVGNLTDVSHVSRKTAKPPQMCR